MFSVQSIISSKILFFVLASVCIARCAFVSPIGQKIEGDVESSDVVGFGASPQCNHNNMSFGQRVYGDWQSFTGSISKSKSILRRTVAEFSYPSGSTRNYCGITFINIENLYKNCNCILNGAEITSGGMGLKNATVKITSDTNCPILSKITIFTKC